MSLLASWMFFPLLGLPRGLDLPPTIEDLSSIRAAGDANGDGTCDLLVADRDGSGAERVRILSGADGSLLRELRGRKAGDWFGFSMACVGDLDGDSIPEIAVGARGGETAVKQGEVQLWRLRQDEAQAYVRVFSGKDGRVLHEFEGDFVCARASDFDADGKLDVLFGAGDSSLTRAKGFVEVRSIAKAKSLLHLTSQIGGPSARSFGASTCMLPDLDSDGIPEIVVCAPGWMGEQGGLSRIVLASGKLGRTIAEAKGDKPADRMGWTLVDAGDLDGDGKPDLLVAAPKHFVRALSGKSLETIYSVVSPGGDLEGFATTLDVVPDLDGDRVTDFVVGCDEEDFLFDGGYATLYSGKDGSMLRPLFDSGTEGVEVCALRNGKWETTDRVALRIRTRREPTDPRLRDFLRRDVLRIVSLRTGESVFEKDLAGR